MQLSKLVMPSLLSALMLSGFTPRVSAQVTKDTTWLGINHGQIAQAALLSDLQATGLHMVRDGMNCVPDSTTDAMVNNYVAAGIDAHISVNMRGSGINVADYPTWLANYKQRCVEIMTAYKGKLHYYIVGNEPDKQDPFTGKLTPQQAVDFTRMAYEASRQVDPSGGIKVESAPLSSQNPINNYFAKMLAAGLTDCCDYIGIHVYSSQIKDGRLDIPWKLMQAQGGTQKPIAASEVGTSSGWAPKGYTPEQQEQWKADFVDQAYVQLRRYGMANVILFESSSTSKWPDTFSLLRDGTAERNLLPTTYSAVKSHAKPSGLQNAGFETANDYRRQWVVYDDPSDGTWDTSAYNFQAPGGHSGASAMQIDTSGNGKGAWIVRQVVEVTPGQAVTISAWAYANNPSGGTLKALGYDQIAGNAETVGTTEVNGKWKQLSVTVTPTNPWVVVELSATAKDAAAGSYVKFDDVAITTVGRP